MEPLDAADQLIELVLGNEGMANHGGGCDEKTLEAVEAQLGLSLPPSYRRLVTKFGTWDIAGEEFLGVRRAVGKDDVIHGAGAATLDARRMYGLPVCLVVVMYDGMGGLVVLDSSSPSRNGEYPVRVWNPAVTDLGDMETLAEDFGNFAFDICKRAVDSLDASDWR
ncbi:SMI1/KNR4 family protein [Actinosynnema sp. NPDC004786]